MSAQIAVARDFEVLQFKTMEAELASGKQNKYRYVERRETSKTFNFD